MSCGDKKNYRCSGVEQYATCVRYELDVPEFSSLDENDCKTIEQTTEDTYEIISQIKTETDLSELGNTCLEYVQEEGKTFVKNVLLKHEEEICTLKQKIEELETGFTVCNTSLEGCNLDFNGLVDECGEEPQTIGEVLQLLLNQNTNNTVNQNEIG